MKILVTGGCGFVGTNICLHLNNKGHKISSLDNLSRKGSKFNLKLLMKSKIKNYKIDIFNYNKISKLPKYDLIIDCCAEAAVEASRSNLTRVINTNLIGTINLLKKIKSDKSKIIFLSSSRVYEIPKINKTFNKKKKLKKIDLNFSTLGPKSIYGLTKLSSEMFIEEFSYAFGIKYIINRCGVISGPLQFGKQDQGFVSHWIWSHINQKNLSYIGYGGNGSQIRDVLHIDDLCKLLNLQIKSFKKKFNLKFNVGGSTSSFTSLKNLTNLCEEISGNKIKFKSKKKTSIYDIPYYLTNNYEVSKAYKWTPKKNIKDIVKDVYFWLKTNRNRIHRYF